MKTLLANPRSAAIFSLILCLPFAVLFTLLALHIEPDFSPLQSLLNIPDQPDVTGSLIALGAFLLVVAAFSINLVQVVRSLRRGGRLMANPASLFFTTITLAAIFWVTASIIADQYPCWVGVLNCD